MKKRNLLAAGVAGLALVGAMPAAAQSIDYGSLEQMFNEPVTTSATGSPQRASQAPVDMDIISAADIERSGATDLPTILSRVAGVDVLQWSAGAADVGVRGYNGAMNPRLLVLVNGRQVYLDFYGYTAWSTLPVRLEEIRQIEVVKGPNAALFGFNAVSGVVNIITYNPRYDAKGFVAAKVGAGDYAEVSIGHTLRLGERFAARLTGGASKQDEFKDTVGVSTAFDQAERLTANIDTVTELSDKLELRVDAGWAHTHENTVASPYSYGGYKYLVTHMKGTLNWDSPVGAVQASAYQNRVSGSFSNKITVASLQDLFKIGADHTIRLSAEYRKTDMPNADGTLQYEVVSAGAMWNWQALDRLSLTLAARYDDLELWRSGPVSAAYNNSAYDRRITEPSYNAGLVWTATDFDTFRATYARGAQIPSLLDMGIRTVIGPGMVFSGNPQLNPTVVTNYGLSYDRALPQIGGSASVRLFYQESRDIKGQPDFGQPDLVTPAIIFTYQNVSDSELRGVETAVKAQYNNGVRWSANYTFTDVEDEAKGSYRLTNRFVAFNQTTPKHRANLNIGWNDADWSVDGFVRYQSKTTLYTTSIARGAPQTVDAFATLGGRVARNFGGGVTMAVSGQNLTEERQRQTTGLEVERRVFVTLSKTW